jgi:hypothetical protein
MSVHIHSAYESDVRWGCTCSGMYPTLFYFIWGAQELEVGSAPDNNYYSDN